MPNRRGVLLGLAAALLSRGSGQAQPIRRVLFIGNSFLREHDVPTRIARLAEAAGKPIDIHVIVRPGARLSGHWGRKIVNETLRWGWEAVVLQDHSLEAMTDERRAASATAIRRIADAVASAAVVLVVPWSRAPGHRLYDQAGMPDGPAEMSRRATEHYATQAAATGALIAPVASAWDGAIAEGAVLHAPDGYHANGEGAALAAEEIWRTLAPIL
ncbi:MAG: hypothetical protein AAGC57_13315 [Pseudomonadota bacterium]